MGLFSAHICLTKIKHSMLKFKGDLKMLKKALAYVIAATLTMIALTQPARAELPTSVGTTFTEIGANIQAIFDLAFPLVALGLGLVIVIKLFKRFGNKV